MYLHTNLKRLRAHRGYGQEVVAAAMDLTRSTLSGYENGAAEPKLSTLVLFADYYRISVTLLLRTDLCMLTNDQLEVMQRSYTWVIAAPTEQPATA